MSKRKRCDYDSDDTENENNELIYVKENKIMFYSDVEPKSIFKLIKAIDKAKKYCISSSYKRIAKTN